jgi:hypothetical protein
VLDAILDPSDVIADLQKQLIHSVRCIFDIAASGEADQKVIGLDRLNMVAGDHDCTTSPFSKYARALLSDHRFGQKRAG